MSQALTYVKWTFLFVYLKKINGQCIVHFSSKSFSIVINNEEKAMVIATDVLLTTKTEEQTTDIIANDTKEDGTLN
jgi:hypothetical protein